MKPYSPYFTPRNNDHDMILRGNLNLNVNLPLPRTDLDRRFITYSGAINWNNLPRALKSINHPVTFKKNIKKHIITRYWFVLSLVMAIFSCMIYFDTTNFDWVFALMFFSTRCSTTLYYFITDGSFICIYVFIGLKWIV